MLHVVCSPSLYHGCLVAKCKSALLRMISILALRWEMKDKSGFQRGHIALGVLVGKARCRRIPGAFKRAVSIELESVDGVQTCAGLLRGIEARGSGRPTCRFRIRGARGSRGKKRSASSQPPVPGPKKIKVSDTAASRFSDHEIYNYFLAIRTP